MVLDAGKEQEKNHRAILEAELEAVGLRLNKRPPNIYYRRKKDGGIKFTSIGPLTQLGPDPYKTVYNILHEYKIHNCDLLFREDVSVDDLIDHIEGNRKYVRCLYVWNKADTVTIEDIDRLAREPHSIVISAGGEKGLNLDRLVERMWDYLSLTRVYTKKRGQAPDFSEPVVLTAGRHGCTIDALCSAIHRSLAENFKYALVWGSSTKHEGVAQHVGILHALQDEDVVQIMKKTVEEEKSSKDYAQKVQAHYDKMRAKNKPKLKS
jgi:ribosome-interacting GTPase 1